jgi:hypothetical protein
MKKSETKPRNLRNLKKNLSRIEKNRELITRLEKSIK